MVWWPTTVDRVVMQRQVSGTQSSRGSDSDVGEHMLDEDGTAAIVAMRRATERVNWLLEYRHRCSLRRQEGIRLWEESAVHSLSLLEEEEELGAGVIADNRSTISHAEMASWSVPP
jgi:hypothetical protein